MDIGDVVELFFINPAEDKPIAHPMHLHGYYFNVIASGPIPESNPMEYVKVLNEIGEINRNLHHPPQKDNRPSPAIRPVTRAANLESCP